MRTTLRKPLTQLISSRSHGLVIDLIHHPSMSEQSIRDLCTSTSTRTTMPSSEVLRRDGGGRGGGGGGDEAAEASGAAEAAEAGVALVSSAR